MNGGYVEITESTLNHVLSRVVTNRSELEAAAVELHEGFFSVTVEVQKVLSARIRVSLEVESVNLTTHPVQLRFRRRGETEVDGGSFFTDLMLGVVGDPLDRLVGWFSFLRTDGEILEVVVEDSPFAPYLDRTVEGFTPEEWFPLRAVECRAGAVRLILDCDDP